jgi:hypothetical protein
MREQYVRTRLHARDPPEQWTGDSTCPHTASAYANGLLLGQPKEQAPSGRACGRGPAGKGVGVAFAPRSPSARSSCARRRKTRKPGLGELVSTLDSWLPEAERGFEPPVPRAKNAQGQGIRGREPIILVALRSTHSRLRRSTLYSSWAHSPRLEGLKKS